jgi:hypothetical protein
MLNSYNKFPFMEYQSAVRMCSSLTLFCLLSIESMEWLIYSVFRIITIFLESHSRNQ